MIRWACWLRPRLKPCRRGWRRKRQTRNTESQHLIFITGPILRGRALACQEGHRLPLPPLRNRRRSKRWGSNHPEDDGPPSSARVPKPVQARRTEVEGIALSDSEDLFLDRQVHRPGQDEPKFLSRVVVLPVGASAWLNGHTERFHAFPRLTPYQKLFDHPTLAVQELSPFLATDHDSIVRRPVIGEELHHGETVSSRDLLQ